MDDMNGGDLDPGMELDSLFEKEIGDETSSQERQKTQEIEAGGRKFKDVSELAKAYGSLHKDYTRKSQEYKKNSDWIEFSKQLEKHPELRDDLSKRIDEYNKRRSAGDSKAEAREASGVSRELASKVERLESEYAQLKLEREMNSLKRKYGVDSDTMREVLAEAESLTQKYGDVPLELVYRNLMFDSNTIASKQAGEELAGKRSAKKRAANVAGSDMPSANATPKKPADMNGDEFRSALNKQLEEFGIN